MARIIAWDIEATGLKADFAYLLSAAFVDVNGGSVKVMALDDYSGSLFGNEKKLVTDVINEMNKADLLVSYFGTGYDHPFMNAKALEYNLPVPAPTPRADLFFTVKSNLAISRKSLLNVSYYIGLSEEKTAVEGRIWKAAMAGDQKAMAFIKEHNAADVRVLSEAYHKLRPLMRTHPRMAANSDSCRACGSLRLIHRGYVYTPMGKSRARVVCKDCGVWGTQEIIVPATLEASHGWTAQEVSA